MQIEGKSRLGKTPAIGYLDPMNSTTLTANDIRATSQRMANGWAAVLEYPNGGRQRFAQRFGTMDDATKEARKLVRVRVAHPAGTVPDPAPDRLQDFSERA